MSRRPPPNSLNRSVLKDLNDRQNFIKLIKSKEFNLERQKELKKIIEDQNKKILNMQQDKIKKLKAGRGKNLRGELTRNKNLQRRYERGERRYKETEEPRTYGDPQPSQAGMSQEDRDLKRDELKQQLSIETRKIEFLEGKELANIDYRDQLVENDRIKAENDRAMRAEENEIARLKLQAERDNMPIPEVSFDIGSHQFINNLLSGVAVDKQREREHTQNIMHQLLEHHARTGGATDPNLMNNVYIEAQERGVRPPGSLASLPPNPSPPSIIELPDRPPPSFNQARENLQRFLDNATSDKPDPDPDEVSSITSTEWDRRVNRAEEDFYATSEGRRLQESSVLSEYAFIDNPLNTLDITSTEQEDLLVNSGLEEELDNLREQQLVGNQLEILEENLEEEQIEEGAGVGDLVAQAGQVLGGAIVGTALRSGDIALRGAGGILQGAGEAVIENLPSAGDVGRAVGGAVVNIAGAGLSAVGGLVGGGAVEEVIEDDAEQQIEETDEGELLEEVPIAQRNPAEIARDNDEFDYGDFSIHHGEQSSNRGPPTLAERNLGAKYSISNLSDRFHKNLNPGQKVDITSYGADKKGDTIGYFGAGGGVSAGAGKRRENKLQTKALDKSISKGFLKLHKNY